MKHTKYTTSLFIQKSNQIHMNKYDYSKSTYVNQETKTIIICPEHGEFLQTPHLHLSGKGCPKCGFIRTKNSTKQTKESFIEKANKVYNNKYNYSNIKWVNNTTRIEIICPEHGSFFQTPKSHLSGHACIKCFYDSIKLTTEDFIKKSNEVHNFKYDYSESVYVSTKKPIKIICKVHGAFYQRANTHLNGSECPLCSLNQKRKDTSTFIEDAIKIHGNRYDYSKTNYTNAYSKIEIICKKHGSFFQLPATHLTGSGCPVCRMSHGEINIIKFFEKYGISYESQKAFNGLKDKNNLLFDFYVPSKKLLIEFNGRQHYEPVDHFGGIEAFNTLKKHDNMKELFAKENGFELLVIKYTDELDEVLANTFLK